VAQAHRLPGAGLNKPPWDACVVTFAGELRKVRKRAQDQGWRVEKRKEYWLFFPPDKAQPPARIAGTPSSQPSWANFLADLKRKGYRP
jgi:hypothetical protein